ncbi:hypothetical protein [Myxosarcina sp. GI1]|uniref:hypothetical protein n=1 Tax=Myxosarcina sp. GI1 TaxID=1541065 RepID=UPI0012E04699|nr:hypothetical protein [Myxosarcina sp. GI1]
MTDLTKYKARLACVDWLIDIYRQHPSMRQVELFKEQLKRKKQEDKNIYQSVKEKLASC